MDIRIRIYLGNIALRHLASCIVLTSPPLTAYSTVTALTHLYYHYFYSAGHLDLHLVILIFRFKAKGLLRYVVFFCTREGN